MEKLESFWNWFITGFCKVEFLCYAGDPNWLGWIILGFGILIFFGIMIWLPIFLDWPKPIE